MTNYRCEIVTERNTTAMARTYQRRRLGVLAGVLALVLAVSPVLAGAGGGDGALDVAAGVPVHATAGSPTAVRGLDDVPSSVVEGSPDTTTAPTTSTTTAPTTTAPTTTQAPATTTTTTETDAEGQESPEPVPTSSKRASTPAPTSTSTSTSTSAAPATTAPPRTTTTTTAAAPAAATSSAEGGYAYDAPRSTQVWYDLAECESGGSWSIDSGNGYYGGLQFSLATWESVGGTGYPHEHPAATQIEMGRRLQARQGWGAWPHCSEELGLR